MANIESVSVTGLRAGELVLMAHNSAPLSDEEWDRNYLEPIRVMKNRGGLDTCANIVFAEGRGPSATQRAEGNAIFGGGHYVFKVSVITSSMMVRGAVTALSWFNPLIRAFSAKDWERAFHHVRLHSNEFQRILEAAQKLRGKIGNVDVLNRYIDSARATLEIAQR